MKPVFAPKSVFWLALIAAVSGLGLLSPVQAADIVAPPPVTFSAQPDEGGSLVYLPVVAQTAGEASSQLFVVSLTIANNATNDLRLNNIRFNFTYADNSVFGVQFARDLTIGAGKDVLEYLTTDEGIQLPNPAPVTVQIQLYFDGYTLPRTIQRPLAAYVAPGGKYLFPANAADLGPDVYFSHIDPHTGGSQFLAYDFHVRGWNGQSFSANKPNVDGSQNEHRFGWGVPIYAMADGVVLRTTSGFEDNPVPGDRVIQRMGDATGNAITEVKVTKLAEDRAASIVREPSGNMRLTIWDLEDTGRVVIQRGSVLGSSSDLIAADALSSNRLVTAARTTGGSLQVVLWDVSTNGAITQMDDALEAGVEEVSLTKISEDRFATAVRTVDDVLRLIVWEVSGGTISLLSHTSAGEASSVAVVALNETRLATSLRTSQGGLKVIVWELLDSGATLDRRGESTADAISKAVAAKSSGSKFDTAMRTAGGNLKVIRWVVSDDGESVTQELEASAGAIQDIAAVGGFESTVMTAVITEAGNFKNILWRMPEDDEPQNLFVRWGEREAGTADRLSIDFLDGGLFFSGVRTSGDELKVIVWWVGSGGGNSFVILHDNCRVLYAHFRDGSINSSIAYPGARVAAGQYLGRMGNSGSSEGPHTHIHAHRVSSFLSVDEIIAQEASGELQLLGFRPVPFHCARAVRLSALQPGGEAANSFSTMQGHGAYFTQFAIRPNWLAEMYVDGSSTCIAPTGMQNCIPSGRLFVNGPFPLVTQALNESCWGHKLFIRAGTYNESVTFRKSMTVRSYDGTAIIRH